MTWALLHLGGFLLGGYCGQRLPGRPVAGWPDDRWITRATALMPVLLTLTRPLPAALVWTTVAGGGLLAGWVEFRQRDARVSAWAPDRWSPSIWVCWNGPAVLQVTSWPSVDAKGRWRCAAAIVTLGEGNGTLDAEVPVAGQGVMLSGDGPSVELGGLVAGQLQLRVPPTASIPGGFDYRRFLAGRHLHWQGRLSIKDGAGPVVRPPPKILAHLADLRQSIASDLARRLPEPESEIMGAVLLGNRSSAARAASDPFADLGMAHLFAVSGLHVGILAAMLMVPLRLSRLPPPVAGSVVVACLPLYVMLTGAPGSVVRAAGLTSLALLAGTWGRRRDALHLLGLLFWLTTVWEPRQVLDSGVRLSYLAAGGILAIQPDLARGGALRRTGLAGTVTGALNVSLAAQWFTLPQVAASFGRISLLSPLANLMGVPVFGLAVWFVVTGLSMGPVCDWLAEAVSSLGWLAMRGLSVGAILLGRSVDGHELGLPVPGVLKLLSLMLMSGMVLVLFQRVRRDALRPRLAVVMVMAILLAGVSLTAWSGLGRGRWTGPRITMLDVGQGDCCLVEFPDGWVALIDTAGRFGSGSVLKRNLLPLLRRRRIRSIDAVFLTHGHLDHTGGCRDLAASIPVQHWYVSGRAAGALMHEVPLDRIHAPEAGDVLHLWQDWRLVCLYPLPGRNIGLVEVTQTTAEQGSLAENDHSLVLALNHHEQTLVLWMGDLEEDGEHILLASDGAPAAVGILKAGHHGSNTSSSTAFLERIRPQFVVISCGTENRYGHPSHGPYLVAGDTLPIYRTDLDGTISIELEADGAVSVRGP